MIVVELPILNSSVRAYDTCRVRRSNLGMYQNWDGVEEMNSRLPDGIFWGTAPGTQAVDVAVEKKGRTYPRQSH